MMDQMICGTCLFTPMFPDYHNYEVSFVYHIYTAHVSMNSKTMIERTTNLIFANRFIHYRMKLIHCQILVIGIVQ